MSPVLLFVSSTAKRTDPKMVNVRVMIRKRINKKLINITAKSGVRIPYNCWSEASKSIKYSYLQKGDPYNRYHRDMLEVRDFVSNRVNTLSDASQFTSGWLKKQVETYWSIRDNTIRREEKLFKKAKDKESLNAYIARFISEVVTGMRTTQNGRLYAKSTIRSLKTEMNVFAGYQKHIGRRLDFKDMDMDFYRAYMKYLYGRGHNINSAGKKIRTLKFVLNSAVADGVTKEDAFNNPKFVGKRVDVDAVFLTRDELDRFSEVSLSDLPKCYEQARDIFLIGCHSAQRVSDYNHLSLSNIKKEKIKTIEGNEIVEREVTFLHIIQQKTKNRVVIPCNAELRKILAKYPDGIPFIWEQHINDYIKVIAQRAGIDEEVEIESTKGGRSAKVTLPKYKLIHTHTARRTGATLMYLSGMDIYDIMKITGHSSPLVLKKYIRADSLQTAQKISGYDYFK